MYHRQEQQQAHHMTLRFSMRAVALAAMAAASIATAVPATAEGTNSGTFDLEIKGFRAGVLQFNGTSTGSSYSVAGRLESTGIAAMVRKIRYDAKASGRFSGGRWSPARYEEQADTGKRQSQSLMEYRSGVPTEMIKESREGRPNYVDPATQGGTVDPLTALYATLRDVTPADACNLKLVMFDGARRSQITLAAAEQTGDTITCAGEYRRLEGFSDKEMAEKQRFPFRLTYGPGDGGMVRVVEVTMDSLYGRASLTRR
jgi:Protein of unknown function (DUF3108)